MGLSNKERQRRFIAKLKAQAKAAPAHGGEARIRELEAENADLKGRLTEEIKARLRREKRAGKPHRQSPGMTGKTRESRACRTGIRNYGASCMT
jgi:hypothetical protein